jgi:hypothetical protein
MPTPTIEEASNNAESLLAAVLIGANCQESMGGPMFFHHFKHAVEFIAFKSVIYKEKGGFGK